MAVPPGPPGGYGPPPGPPPHQGQPHGQVPPPPPGGWGGGQPYPYGGAPPEHRGFFSGLFDVSFENLITPRVIKVLYILTLVILSLAAVGYFIFGIFALTQNAGLGLLIIIGVPIVWLLYVIGARVWLEVLIVVFKMGEDISALRRRDAPR